jgi:hypothetical protein
MPQLCLHGEPQLLLKVLISLETSLTSSSKDASIVLGEASVISSFPQCQADFITLEVLNKDTLERNREEGRGEGGKGKRRVRERNEE